jgi:hypothetical protein
LELRKNVIPNKIEWNNIIFNFDEDKPIATKDLWSGLIPISREVCIIFNRIINSDEIKKITFYDDPTESLI